MRFASALLIAAVLPTSSFAQKHNDVLKNFLQDKTMIHVPEVDQNKVAPGTIIVIRNKDGVKGWFGGVAQASFIKPRPDVPKAPEGTVITIGHQKVAETVSVDGGLALLSYKLAAQIKDAKILDYQGMDMPTKELEENQFDDILLAKKATSDMVFHEAGFHPDGDTSRWFLDKKIAVYLVTNVAYTSDIKLTATSDKMVALANGKLVTTCPAVPKEKAEDPVKKPDQPQAEEQPVADKPKDATDSDEPVSTTGVVPEAHLTICKSVDGSYDFKHTPAVPIGMQLLEVVWDTQLNALQTRSVDDFKKIKIE